MNRAVETMQEMRMGRRLRNAGSLAAALLVAGCCVTPPAAEKYFDRGTALGTVKMFQYAIEAKQYETAYACLSPETQEALSFGKFRLELDLQFDRRELGGLETREFIIGSSRHPIGEDAEEGVATVMLLYGEETVVDVVLLRFGAEWLIDGPASFGNMGPA